MLYAGSNLNTLRSLGPINHDDFLNRIASYIKAGADLEDITSMYSLCKFDDNNILEIIKKFKEEASKNIIRMREENANKINTVLN